MFYITADYKNLFTSDDVEIAIRVANHIKGQIYMWSITHTVVLLIYTHEESHLVLQ